MLLIIPKSKLQDDDNSDDELEYDPSMYPQRVGRQKHVLDIQFHFNDGRRGGLNRGRGGRPRVGGPNNAGERGDRRGPNRNRSDNDGNERTDGDRPSRPPREDRRERRGPFVSLFSVCILSLTLINLSVFIVSLTHREIVYSELKKFVI